MVCSKCKQLILKLPLNNVDNKAWMKLVCGDGNIDECSEIQDVRCNECYKEYKMKGGD